MQTITRNGSNISLWYFDDSTTVTVQSEKTIIGDVNSPDLIIQDCTTDNVTLHTGVDAKADWYGQKYKYDGSSWSENADFVSHGILNEDINDSVTTIPVLNIASFRAGGDKVRILNERISYTGVDGNNLTGVTRAVDSTDAASYTKDTPIMPVKD
tara:strand:+ start:567 stop:1031 length:465 start_codon:yes stop_codon:yes gene_type:complete